MSLTGNCDLCGSENITKITLSLSKHDGKIGFTPSASDFGIFYPLAKCKDCDVIFSIINNKEVEIRRFYTESKDDIYLSQSAQRTLTGKAVLSHIKPFIPENGRILDIGCSYGLFLQSARDSGLQVFGVELSKDACRHCTQSLGLNVYCGELEHATFHENFFDAIVAIEVIEHVDNPDNFIADIQRILKPGGILYLVTPNTQSLSGKLLGYRWWSYRRMHLYYFSKNSLSKFLRKKNFSIMHTAPYKKTFTIKYILHHLLNIERLIKLKPFFIWLDSLSWITTLHFTASFGDIAVTAKKQ